jgi:DNA-binding MarR family transcriptional regulator
MTGAFALAVSDAVRAGTEDLVGRAGGAAAALTTIVQFPDRSVEFLRRAIGLSHSATVRVVDQLVADGLVLRARSASGPAVALTATSAGHDLAAAVLARRQQVLVDAVSGLTDAEAAVLTSLLDALLIRVADDSGTTACRLCDQQQCRARGCPVVGRLTELGAPPTAPGPPT